MVTRTRGPRALADGSPLPVHVVVPDTQTKQGTPTAHLTWIAQFLLDEFCGHPNVRWIHLGDHADMPSLSSYDRKGGRLMEGRRFVADIAAANSAFEALNQPLADHNARRKSKHASQWWPQRDILIGNHEARITRAVDQDAQLEGLLSLDALNYRQLGWTVHEFLKPTEIDGVSYSHYWANPLTGRPYTGHAMNRLKQLGHTFTMGHQQVLDYAVRFVAGRSQHALVAGSCYLHSEHYLGWQGNAQWRGIIVCHDVIGGSYSPMFVSLDYLCRRYEGTEIADFVQQKYGRTYLGGESWDEVAA